MSLVTDYLAKKGLTEYDIYNLGGVVLRDKQVISHPQANWYNKFRGYMLYKQVSYAAEGIHECIFLPIFDLNMQVGGIIIRKMGGTKHDSHIVKGFDKKSLVFGLHASHPHILAHNKVYVFEGQYDFIKAFSSGIPNCVSLMGTNLTEQQILLLRMFTENICVVMDADKAGDNAREKIVKKCEGIFNTSFIRLDRDPDEFINTFGIDVFRSKEETMDKICIA